MVIPLPQNVEDWPPEWRELYEERAGVIEYLGNVSRLRAQAMAEQDTRKTYVKQEGQL